MTFQYQKESFPQLRARAQGLLGSSIVKTTNTLRSYEKVELVRELQVHHIELELQNQDLLDSQLQLQLAHNEYRDLYENAPIGYVTLDRHGRILRANNTLCEMFGVQYAMLINVKFSDFVIPEDQDTYYKHHREIVANERPLACQLRTKSQNEQPVWAELKGILINEGSDPKGAAHYRMVVADISEQRRIEETLLLQEKTDSLTGLMNRGEFEATLNRFCDKSRLLGLEFAVCFIDLDQFKVVNDTCGHMAGDELLKQLSVVLGDSIRKQDSLARLGGDEFGVLLTECNAQHATKIGEKILDIITGFRFEWMDNRYRVSASIGLVSADSRCGSVTQLMSDADSACYAAKDDGRNRVHHFVLGDEALSKRRGEMDWVSRLELALEDQRFQLWQQEITAVAADQTDSTRFEILLRLVDENGEIQAPGNFLPAAERYGLSSRIDEWVVTNALEWLSCAPIDSLKLERCFINLSGSSLGDAQFLEKLIHHLSIHRSVAPLICFEITETASIANLAKATHFINEVKAMGCKFALDDFGSGFSSFSYLQVLPVDYLKIDGHFVKDMADNPVNLSLVKAINDIGKVMGKLTVAEFVEDAETLSLLSDIGVDYAQGYGIALPKPLDPINQRPEKLAG